MANTAQSPFLYSDYIYKWLDNALDYGINECDFWNMSLAELNRAIASKKRIYKLQAQENATYDYILADLIGRSISRVYNSANKMPDIGAVYPSIFDSKEIKESKAQKKLELSALRFRQFAQSYNNKYKEVVKDE